MHLDELKTLLEIPTTDISRDALLGIQLEAAIEEVQGYCNQDFINRDGVIELPGAAKMAIRILVQGMNTNEAIQADSVAGGMSKTYRTGGYKSAAKQYLKPFRRVKVITWGDDTKHE